MPSAAKIEIPVPYDRAVIREAVSELRLDLKSASIRDTNKLVNTLQQRLGVEFIRMEFGVPGLPTPTIAVDAEIHALREQQLGSVYAPFEGIPELKEEAAKFVKLFMDVEVPPSCCVPTVGAMQGCFASIALAGRLASEKNTLLCLMPGFPVNTIQTRFLGVGQATIDFYDYRGERLIEAVDERVRQGDICGILWSSPNNPSWVVLTDEELVGLGKICDQYGIVAIEDLAYFGMDTRVDYFVPGQPPYQPTVMRHAKRAICIISSSKIFSYAGQRIAMTILSPELMASESTYLEESYGTKNVGEAFLSRSLYPLTACAAQAPQHGLLALLRAANAGDRSVFEPAQEYSRRARIMKKLFVDNGFRLVYDRDGERPLADGFYFTISYPSFEHGGDLLAELLHYGISAITLGTTGSCRTEGLRACVSTTGDEKLAILARRLERFREDHPL